MTKWFDGDRYHRRNARRSGHEYHKASAYFVTIRTHNSAHLFGTAGTDELQVNDAGLMLVRKWHALEDRFENVAMDEFVVMPDHIHGILTFDSIHDQQASDAQSVFLGRVIQAYKSITTKNYISGVRNYGWPEFDAKIWQRNYHERIIRNTDERDAFRRYIRENPGRWLEKHRNQNKI